MLWLITLASRTVCLALRWTITGTIPMSNGYETMLFLAWAVMLLAVAASRRFSIMLTFACSLTALCIRKQAEQLQLLSQLMLYPAHRSLATKTMPYHVYMTFAFLTLLMTYFGVNYFLDGMHSYA